MTRGYVRVVEGGAEHIAFVSGDHVFDVDDLVGSDLPGLIASGQINDVGFTNDLLSQLVPARCRAESFQALLDATRGTAAFLGLAFRPPEVWGAGVSYKVAADLHEEDMRKEGRALGLYDYVYSSQRPEIFFKALGRHVVGHQESFGVRHDSTGTIIEAELACVFDAQRDICAFTIANDVTAWDIEKESPLFLSYAKLFNGSCGLGPVIVPRHLVPDPHGLEVRCRLVRGDEAIFTGVGHTSRMARSLDELRAYLCEANDIAAGTVLCTGTAIGVPHNLGLEDGDRVVMEIDTLGALAGTARREGRRNEWRRS